jgi:hypothetical protein
VSGLVTAPRLGAAEPACDIKISGDQRLTVHQEQKEPGARASSEDASSAGKTNAGSDYWASDDEMRRGLESLISSESFMTKLSAEELRKRVDERMKRDPRMTPLNFGCGNSTASVTLMASPSSRYADVPHKPGKYRITPEKGSKPGDFNLIFTASHGIFTVSAPGKLELTRFDAKGVAGKYSFDAVKDSGGDPSIKRVVVTGSFNLRCRSGSRCQR